MTSKHPNILLIMTDNHPAELLGCYGNHEIYTPNLDRLARQGFQFNNAFCVNAMCSPCRASVLTGLMPSQHGIHTWLDDRIMDNWPARWNAVAEFVTLPELLQTNGYQTALIGKYHLGMPFEPQNGFEYWVTFPHGHTRNFWSNTVIDNGRQYTYPGHTVDFFTEKTVEYLNNYNPESDRPFFIFLTYNAPYGHWPAIKGKAKNRFARLYETTEMTSVPREGVSEKVIARYDVTKHLSGGGVDYRAHIQIPNDLITLRNYFSQMTLVDDGVGRVLAALQQNGLDNDTLVIYTCDHGYSLGHNGFWGHGQATWPSNAHRAAYNIPLLIRHSNHMAPLQESNLMVSQIDLFPTILDYAGLSTVQANANSPATSFEPLLSGNKFEWKDAVFIEQEETRAIRTPEWVYMKRFKGSRAYPFEDELYNLSSDPAEKHNLITDPACAEIGQQLSSRIDDFFRQYSTPAYDLWQGGAVKCNTDRPWLWQDAWGEGWKPTYEN